MRILMILNILIPIIALISCAARASDIGGAALRDQLAADFSHDAIQSLAKDSSKMKLTLISGENDAQVCAQDRCTTHSQVRFLTTVDFRTRIIFGQLAYSAKTFLVDIDKDMSVSAPAQTTEANGPANPPTTGSQVAPNGVQLGTAYAGGADISDAIATEFRTRMTEEFAQATMDYILQQSSTEGSGLRHIISFYDNTEDDPSSNGTINLPLINSDVKLTLIQGEGNAADCEQRHLCKTQSQAQFLVTIASRSKSQTADNFSAVSFMVNVKRDTSLKSPFQFDLIPEEILLNNN